MDAKDLRTEAALGDRSNDGNTKYAHGNGVLPFHRNKSYQDIGSISLAKVDAPTARPCAVIGPDRVIPPPVSTDAYLKKGPIEPWLTSDNTYRRPPDYPHKLIDYQHPTRNISPRQTFQENMQRIMVPPSYNSLKLKEDHSFSEANGSQMRNNKLNVPTDSNSKYCDVPYTINPLTNEQKNVRNSDVSVSNMNTVLSRSVPHGWPSVSASIQPPKPYPQDLYQYPDYPSCAGPRPMLMTRPHRTVHEEPGPVYPDAYYHDGSIRFKPYPTVKERYPQPRYDYISNYPNPFHPPPPFPSHKYDLQKASHPFPGYPQVPLKYLDGRMPEPIMNGYQRPMNQQANYNNLPFRNQVIHQSYGPIPGNCLQPNKFYSYPAGSSKPIASNKLPYDANGKIYADYENSRTKSYPLPEGFYVNEIPRPHPMKGQGLPPNYPSNLHTMPGHPYFRKENLPLKGYEYSPHFRNIDPTMTNNHLSRFPSQFSPNTIAISPADSNTSNDTNQTQGTSQEDCGYVSQSSTASVRSIDSNLNRMPPDFYRRYDHRYGAMMKTSHVMSKLDTNSHASRSAKEKKDLDVRQFLQMWNEGEDDNGENSKEVMVKTVSNSNDSTNHYENNQEQLYVLGLVNVPSEELSKYEHIQKVSKLPENIKGYNSIELLHQFEEVIESSNLSNFSMKPPSTRDFRPPLKGSLPMHGISIPSRPLSPLDVEAKISQSVIHKEVGCNFEIKPCSPKMLNVEVATSVQTVLGERAIEKVSNPLIIQSPSLHSSGENGENCNIIKCQDRMSVNENSKVNSCKMINTQYTSNALIDPVKTNYSLQDLESNSGVCLASLPRLDNDIELNFPEVNQQFINANKDSVITTASTKDLPSLDMEKSDVNRDVVENKTSMSNVKCHVDKDFSKLSKYRKLKRKSSGPCTPDSNVQNLRTDSVIIKNPENCKSYENDIDKVLSPHKKSENNQDDPINLSVSTELRQNITEPDFDINNQSEIKSNDFAIDFSLSSNEQCDFDTNIPDHLQSKLTKEIHFSEQCNDSPAKSQKDVFDVSNDDVCNFLKGANLNAKFDDVKIKIKINDGKESFDITKCDDNNEAPNKSCRLEMSNEINSNSDLSNTSYSSGMQNCSSFNKDELKAAQNYKTVKNITEDLTDDKKTLIDEYIDKNSKQINIGLDESTRQGENCTQNAFNIGQPVYQNINEDKIEQDSGIEVIGEKNKSDSKVTIDITEILSVSESELCTQLSSCSQAMLEGSVLSDNDKTETITSKETQTKMDPDGEESSVKKIKIDLKPSKVSQQIKYPSTNHINKELLSPYIQNLILHNEGLCATGSTGPHSENKCDLEYYSSYSKFEDISLLLEETPDVNCKANLEDQKLLIDNTQNMLSQESTINSFTSSDQESSYNSNSDSDTSETTSDSETEIAHTKNGCTIKECTNMENKFDDSFAPAKTTCVDEIDNISSNLSVETADPKIIAISQVTADVKKSKSTCLDALILGDSSTKISHSLDSKPIKEESSFSISEIHKTASYDKSGKASYEINHTELTESTTKVCDNTCKTDFELILAGAESVAEKNIENVSENAVDATNENNTQQSELNETMLKEPYNFSGREDVYGNSEVEDLPKSELRSYEKYARNNDNLDLSYKENRPAVEQCCTSGSNITENTTTGKKEESCDSNLVCDNYKDIVSEPYNIANISEGGKILTKDLNLHPILETCFEITKKPIENLLLETKDHRNNTEGTEDQLINGSNSKNDVTILESSPKRMNLFDEFEKNSNVDEGDFHSKMAYSCNYVTKRCNTLKRSLSDSALDGILDSPKEAIENTCTLWPSKRKKNTEADNSNEQNNFFTDTSRRNSISAIQNVENVSFCILIDNNCIITEECDESEKICFTDVPEDCLSCLEDIHVNNKEDLTAEEQVSCQNIDCEYFDPSANFIQQDKSVNEPWVDDIACVETVITDDIAEDIVISTATSPKHGDLSDGECTDDETEMYNVNEHSDKLKYIYGDNMCRDDTHFVETLYRTPQMNVNKTLVNRESQIIDDCTRYYDKESLERVLSESNVPEEIGCISNDNDITTHFYLSSPVNSKQSPGNKENLQLGDSSSRSIKTPFECKEINLDIVSDNAKYEESDNRQNLFHKKVTDDAISSCESATDDIFCYKNNEVSPTCTVSSSPEVSSTTSEEKNSGILLKITNYGGSRVSQVNDVNDGNRISCKYTEKKDYLSSSNSNLPTRTLITKAAQKYIPPLKETIRDLKIKLPLPQHSLLKLKQLKVAKETLKPNVSKPDVVRKDVPKKAKPKFEDVLKSIDEIQFQKHKEKSKKIKKSIPKVVIKKTENGSHYASTSRKDIFNPDLTGRKWQPWVFLEKNHFIDKMALKKKTKAIFSHRKNTYVLAEKFQKYKSIGNTKFTILQPKVNDSLSGQLKYTIRLKHNF